MALHRLLLAILHRNFGPPGRKAWFDLWKRGSWDEKKLSDYFRRWDERFELFHPERPFYQAPEMEGVGSEPVSVLVQELSSGNNATLFDHTFDASNLALTPSTAARALIAQQTCAIAYGRGYSPGPLGIRAYSVLFEGETLFETLALNLLRYDDEHPFARARNREDLPAWEQDRPAPARKEGNRPAGYLDYLTWQSRRIHLFLDEDTLVRLCQRKPYFRFSEAGRPSDPFIAYRILPEHGHVPLRFEEERSLWRDSAVLSQSTNSSQRPATAEWLASLALDAAGRDAGLRKRYQLSAFGLTTAGEAARVMFWRHERLPLPLAYLSEPALLGRIAEAIGYAEEVARDLRESVWALARTMFQPLDSANGHLSRQEKDAKRLAQELAPMRLYWPALEAPFVELMTAIAQIKPQDREARLIEWRKLVRRIARESFGQVTRELDTGARALRAVAEGERAFWRKIREGLAPGEEV